MSHFKPLPMVILGVLAAGATAGWFARRALADGIPAANALTYTGVLEDATGTPLTGSKNVGVQLWSAATGGTTPLCQTASQALTLVGGRFQVQLPDTCTAALHANADAWVEVFVEGASLGRTKLGAVPYAVEADHASVAGGASGALDARIGTLEKFRGFSAHISSATIPVGWSKLSPDALDFDTTSGYDAAQAAFIAPMAGYWRFSVLGASATQTTSADSRIAFGFRVNMDATPPNSGGGQLSTTDSPLPNVSRILKLAGQDRVDLIMYTVTQLSIDGTLSFQGEYLGQ